MAFNKTKHLDAAQKFLSQGKISLAITEYQHILRVEPSDQVTLMTVGDLSVRSGDTAQATDYFERLAQVFLNEGFISKGIAIYKKIAKLAPEQLSPLERLADLYVQQGVMSEARPIYIQIAETHLRAKQPEKAVEVLRRLLDLEPDNLRVQMRLAELHQAIGQKSEAARAYTVAAHRLFEKSEYDAALALLARAVELEPASARATTLKARVFAATHKPAEGAKLLETLPDAHLGELTTALLLELYQQAGQPARAAEIARKVVARAPNKYELALRLIDSLIEAGELELTLELGGDIRGPMIEAGERDRLAEVLGKLIERMPKRLEPREWLVVVYRQSSDAFRLTEALDQLGDAAVSAGNLARAREVFEELLEREPQNEHNRRRLSQVLMKLGFEPLEAAALPVRPETPAETVVPAPPEEAPAELVPAAAESATALPAQAPAAAGPPAEDETERYIAQALTDVDLFSSYNLTQKAIDLLESVLRRAPRHPAALEKLLDLYLGAGNDRRTAELAAQLEEIYQEKGDESRVERFADLRRRFGRVSALAEAGAAEAPSAPPEFAVPLVEKAAPAGSEAAPVAEGQAAVHEVDLSEDWAALASQVTESPEAPTAAEPEPAPELHPVAEEEEATAPPAQPVPEVEEARLGEPTPGPAPAPAPAFEEIELSLESVAPATPAPIPPAAEEAAKPAEEEVLEYDLELSAPGTSGKSPGKSESTKQLLADLARELDNLDFGGLEQPAVAAAPPTGPGAPAGPPQPPTAPASPAALAASALASAGTPGTPDHLREVFEEFRAELGEMGEEEEEDLETHYNLGIAYREMDLVEEAIGEFQKVAKLIQAGRPFRYTMQCYTLLGLCFMDRGEPKIAAMWYQKALQVPGLDQESILALRYDLGVAQELAGEGASALDSFTQVYAMNIDYRDVADRIAGLQKQRR